jgi:predicted Fe-Mo cluster-binding NifX family protein
MKKTRDQMKIAIPTRANVVEDHFGHSEYYSVFTISENNKILGSSIIQSPQGCGCKSFIAWTLRDMGVSLMLAGNMGQGAINKLNNAGIEVIRGCNGNVNDVVLDYLSDKISDSGVSCSLHEQHRHREGGCQN